MMPEAAVWLILLLPIVSLVVIAVVVRPFLGARSPSAGLLTISAVGGSFLLSIWALSSTAGAEGGDFTYPLHSWLTIGEFDFSVGILMDPLTAIMLVVVSGVSLVVQVYSVGYMHGDPGYARYFAYMSLFTAAMLGLVLANNIIQMFVFWELVGLGSYLLIGFWFERPAAAAAAKKAFIVTRIGDFGFMLAILYLVFNQDAFAAQGLDPFVVTDIYEGVGTVVTGAVAAWLAAGIFAGAVGKSAQFPLHTWLPDAMEGPTPVSALIHAATMVAAGVFLVARFFPVFSETGAEPTMTAVALVGGVTAIFAASMGLVMNDIKRVLAYSTVSQLGYMMLALGVGAYGAAIFHLFTHAFFKALLFLGAGSVNHATGTFDMRYMGGLRRVMPWTYLTFLFGSLSLAGIFPLSGFWSKDEILAHAANGDAVAQLVFWLALVAVFMTAFYMFRALFMTFGGDFRGGAVAERGAPAYDDPVHLHESPRVMVWPLVVLAVAAIVAGFLVNPPVETGPVPAHALADFLNENPLLGGLQLEIEPFNAGLAALSSAVAVAGIFLAYLMYSARLISPNVVGTAAKPLWVLLSRKYYLDELYEDVAVVKGFYRSFARPLDWADRAVVDRIASGIGWLGANTGSAVRQVQTGQLQGYGMVISVGILVIFGVFFFLERQ